MDYRSLNKGLWKSGDALRDQRYCFGKNVIQSGKTVLEIGSATGDSEGNLGKGNRIIALDIVQDYLGDLPDNYSGAVGGNAVYLPFQASKFEAIFAAEFIEHLSFPDAERFLREAHRVLIPGGVIILTTPNPDYWRTRMFRIKITGGPHLKVYPPWELQRTLHDAGFRVVKRRGLGRVELYLGGRFLLNFYGDYGFVAEKVS